MDKVIKLMKCWGSQKCEPQFFNNFYIMRKHHALGLER